MSVWFITGASRGFGIELGEDCFTAVAGKLARTARDQARWREISISTGYRA